MLSDKSDLGYQHSSGHISDHMNRCRGRTRSRYRRGTRSTCRRRTRKRYRIPAAGEGEVWEQVPEMEQEQ